MSDSLRNAIGDPDEYRHTGNVFKSKGETYCPCGVKIVNLFEIIHEIDGRVFLIGSICAKRVGIYIGKRCVMCDKPNKMKTTHCGDCRNKCPLHKIYHPGNIVHASKKMNFNFGKHKGKSPDLLLGSDDGYLIWVVNQTEWKNAAQRQYIIDNLLPKCCQANFRKYPTTSLSDLKVKDPEYFAYMLTSDRGCYLQYI